MSGMSEKHDTLRHLRYRLNGEQMPRAIGGQAGGGWERLLCRDGSIDGNNECVDCRDGQTTSSNQILSIVFSTRRMS